MAELLLRTLDQVFFHGFLKDFVVLWVFYGDFFLDRALLTISLRLYAEAEHLDVLIEASKAATKAWLR